MKRKDIIEIIITVCVLVGMIVGGLNYLAKAADLQLVEMRLDQKITADQIMQLQQQTRWLENNNYGPCTNWTNKRDKDEYQKLQEQIEILKRKRDALINQTIRR